MKITSGRVWRRIFQGVLGALGGVHLQPVAFQHAAENHAGRARVVDDQGSLGHSARMIVAKVITDNAASRPFLPGAGISRGTIRGRREYAAEAPRAQGGWLPWRTRPQISAILRWWGRPGPARRCWPRACSPSPARSAAAAASSAARRFATSIRRSRSCGIRSTPPSCTSTSARAAST